MSLHFRADAELFLQAEAASQKCVRSQDPCGDAGAGGAQSPGYRNPGLDGKLHRLRLLSSRPEGPSVGHKHQIVLIPEFLRTAGHRKVFRLLKGKFRIHGKGHPQAVITRSQIGAGGRDPDRHFLSIPIHLPAPYVSLPSFSMAFFITYPPISPGSITSLCSSVFPRRAFRGSGGSTPVFSRRASI